MVICTMKKKEESKGERQPWGWVYGPALFSTSVKGSWIRGHVHRNQRRVREAAMSVLRQREPQWGRHWEARPDGAQPKEEKGGIQDGPKIWAQSFERIMASLIGTGISTGERRRALLGLCWIYSDSEVDLEVSSWHLELFQPPGQESCRGGCPHVHVGQCLRLAGPEFNKQLLKDEVVTSAWMKSLVPTKKPWSHILWVSQASLDGHTQFLGTYLT